MTADLATRFHALIRGDARGPGPAAARAALWWARFPYAAAVAARNTLFDRGWKTITRAPVPVISVGNLTVGGTGKTPCVEWVARTLRTAGHTVVILSRGYKATHGPNDEALVLEHNLPDVPHLQGPDRAALALTAVEELEAEMLVLDDGFQHRRLHRDLNLVLVDCTQPLLDDYLLPRGLLREPLSALNRADAVIATRADAVDRDPAAAKRLAALTARLGFAPALATHAPVELVNANGETATLASIHGPPVFAFAGVGNPAAVQHTLRELGADVRDFRPFPDHHPYTRADVEQLTRAAAQLPPGGLALTTQKDLVKLRLTDLNGVPLWAVRIGFRFLSGEASVQAQLARLGPASSAI